MMNELKDLSGKLPHFYTGSPLLKNIILGVTCVYNSYIKIHRNKEDMCSSSKDPKSNKTTMT